MGLVHWKIQRVSGDPRIWVDFRAEFIEGSGVRPLALYAPPLGRKRLLVSTAANWQRVLVGTKPLGFCADPTPWRLLDAGTLTVSGPGFGPFMVRPLLDERGIHYLAGWPQERWRPGVYRVQASGGADVGPFETTVHIPEPIEPEQDYPPGSVLDTSRPLPLSWRNGSPQTQVQAMLLQYESGTLAPLGRQWWMLRMVMPVFQSFNRHPDLGSGFHCLDFRAFLRQPMS